MKQGCFFLLLLLTQLASAVDAPTLLDIKNPNIGATHFIRDVISVPLRSGKSSQHRVIHRGLKSSTTVTLLEVDPESGYSLIKTNKGLEGWIPSQYVIAQPTNKILLQRANASINQLKKKAGPIGEQVIMLEKENQALKQLIQQLEQEKGSLSSDYENLRKISEQAVELHEENQRLLNSNENYKHTHDTLAAENASLQTQLRNDGFINGALVLGLGMVLTLIAQYFKQNRRRSEWG